MAIIRVGTRNSPLALQQAQWVCTCITKKYPNYTTEIVPFITQGDREKNRSLATIGGKGLFTRELEQALRINRIDIAIHSLKDMPQEATDDLALRALSKRATPFDALLRPLDRRPIRTIGTSSPRRMAHLRLLYPNAQIVSLRGNVQTRMQKMENGVCDATVLAVAGLERLNLVGCIDRIFMLNEMIPAAGQGILAIQGRKEDEYAYLDAVHDEKSVLAYQAESAFLQTLQASCTSAVGAYCQQEGSKIAFYGMIEGKTLHSMKRTAWPSQASQLGQEVAMDLAKKVQDE